MSTDLKAVKDHPVHVLNQYSADAFGAGNTAYGDIYSIAATRLFGYEIENDVTFAALDNEALGWVQDAYKNLYSEYEEQKYTMDEFVYAVRDLLGLDD